jgi:hypothetical protein
MAEQAATAAFVPDKSLILMRKFRAFGGREGRSSVPAMQSTGALEHFFITVSLERFGLLFVELRKL